MPSAAEMVRRAWEAGKVIPAFNISYLPMMRPVVAALRDTRSMGLVAVARLEWVKFGAVSLRAVAEEYQRWKDERYVRLHLDHVPVVDEDNQRVEVLPIIQEALSCGYHSVMVDGSRLPLHENIAATRAVVELGHAAGVPVEAELGAVLGHEAGPLPSYEELFATRRGFTDPGEAARFIAETGADWLSVAVGNVHGAIAAGARDAQKVQARLDLEHLARLRRAVNVPFVLHGGSGIRREDIALAARAGIAKVNVATAIRQPFERWMGRSIESAQEAVYQAALQVLTQELPVLEV